MKISRWGIRAVSGCLLALATGSAFAQKMVTIKGTVHGDTKGYNKIYTFGKDTKSDSALIKDGHFEINIPFEKPFFQQFHLEYTMQSRMGYALYGLLIDRPGTVYLNDINIEKGIASANVSGMTSATDLLDFETQRNAIMKAYYEKKYGDVQPMAVAPSGTSGSNAAAPAGRSGNNAGTAKGGVPASGTRGDKVAASNAVMPASGNRQGAAPAAADAAPDRVPPVRNGGGIDDQAYKAAFAKLLESFIKTHPGSYASAYLLSAHGRSEMTPGDMMRLYSLLSPEMKNSPAGIEIRDFAAGLEKSKEGQFVEDFTLTATDGRNIRFSDFKGKYVLVDFWASWCGPCKASFPHLKELYSKYKGDKFEVYGISIDKSKEAWLQESKKQALPWPHTLDTKNISQSGFAVTAVPMTYLIGPNGQIIMKMVGMDPNGNSPIEQKLKELFD